MLTWMQPNANKSLAEREVRERKAAAERKVADMHAT